ncbi:MAG: glycosyltransferase, partial [Candidatus Omnitrophota bacterium]
MRIAFLTPGFVTEEEISGGLVNYLYQTCLSLIKLGHQPVVITASKKNGVVFHNGIEVHRVKVKNYLLSFLDIIILRQFTRSLAYLYQSRKLNREAMKAHRKDPFAVIQCASSLAVGLFRPEEVPTVVRISSHPGLWRKAKGKTYFHLDQRIACGLEIRAAARADAIFAPSRIIADIIRKETGKPVTVIETPVSAEISETDDRLYRDLLAGRDYLFFFGSLDRRKGVDVIAEILFELLEKYPKLLFVFIGQDSGYQKRIMMSGYLRQKAGPHQKRVLCPGRVTREQLYPVLDNAL